MELLSGIATKSFVTKENKERSCCVVCKDEDQWFLCKRLQRLIDKSGHRAACVGASAPQTPDPYGRWLSKPRWESVVVYGRIRLERCVLNAALW